MQDARRRGTVTDLPWNEYDRERVDDLLWLGDSRVSGDGRERVGAAQQLDADGTLFPVSA